jgi:hypothetical protein
MIAFELGSGNDFAGAVKERQGRADRQLFNTWGSICPLRILWIGIFRTENDYLQKKEKWILILQDRICAGSANLVSRNSRTNTGMYMTDLHSYIIQLP